MKNMAIAAAVVGASALAVGVWAQNPGRPPEGGRPNPERMRAEMRERMMQHMQQRGHVMPGMAGHVPMRPEIGRGHEGEHGEILKRVLENPEIAKKAGVTDEQIKKLKDGQFNFDKQMITMRADAEVAKMEVKRLMDSDKVDRGAVEKALDAAGAKELAIRKLSLMRMLDVKETLGAESIEKIKNVIREHMIQRMKMAHPVGQPGGDRPMMRPPQRDGERPQREGDKPQPREGREQKRDS